MYLHTKLEIKAAPGISLLCNICKMCNKSAITDWCINYGMSHKLPLHFLSITQPFTVSTLPSAYTVLQYGIPHVSTVLHIRLLQRTFFIIVFATVFPQEYGNWQFFGGHRFIANWSARICCYYNCISYSCELICEIINQVPALLLLLVNFLTFNSFWIWHPGGR